MPSNSGLMDWRVYWGWLFRNWLDILLAGFVFVQAFYVRWWFAMQRTLMPPGDPFNFLQGARTLPYGFYSPVEKRPPGYSFFIAVVDAFVNEPYTSAVFVAVFSGAAALVCLYLIGRRFKVPGVLLAAVLVLATFDPLLVVMGVRPLSQSLFFFLAVLSLYLTITIKEKRWWIIFMGVVLVLLPLTRVEGVPIALGLLIALRLRVSWNVIAKVVGVMLLVLIPWLIVVTRSTGAPWRLPGAHSYVEETSSGMRGTTDPIAVARGVVEVLADSWVLPWSVPAAYLEHPEDIQRSYFIDLFRRPDWWLSLFALFGLVAAGTLYPKSAWPSFFVFTVVVLIAAWYRPSGKYAAPTIGAWYLFAAGGLSLLLFRLRRFRVPITYLLVLFIVAAGLMVTPSWAERTYGQVTDGGGRGYSLFKTVEDLSRVDGNVAFGDKVLMAEPYLGLIESHQHPPHRSIMLFQIYPDATTDELVEIMRDYEIRYLVERDNVRMTALVNDLISRGVIVYSQTRSYPYIDDSGEQIDLTTLHTLHW